MGLYKNGVKLGQPYKNGVKMNACRNGVKMFEDRPPPPTTEFFGMTVNSGSDSEFILPLKYGDGTAHHDLTIWWGDGKVQKTTGNAGITAQYQGLTHSYPATNTDYEIRIAGTTYLSTGESDCWFGLGFTGLFGNGYGYNVATNTTKVKKLLGSPWSLMSSNISTTMYCFLGMFQNCSSLTEIPADLLPATTLGYGCYSIMFQNCSSLTEIPADLLPATSTITRCYRGMFNRCTGLTKVPANLLPAATPSMGGYELMFANCTSLTFIYMAPSWFSGKTAQDQMFKDCTKITANTPYASIPSGWK
jgi:hypothetical protein